MKTAIPRDFRPAPVPLGEKLRIAFFAAIALGGVRAVIVEPSQKHALLVGVGFLLLGAALWLSLRHRVPGSPRLAVDSEGMEYRRGSRVERLAWSDVARIEVDFYRDEIRFVSTGGAKVSMFRDMMAANGDRFIGLMEDYWTPPKPARSGKRAR